MVSVRLPIAAWRRLGLRTRLSVGYAASLSLLLFVYAALVYAVAYERLSIEVDHRLDQEVEIAERSLVADASGLLVWRPAAASADFETLPNMLWIDVHRADASLLHRSLGGYARGGRVEPLAFQARPSGFFAVEMPNGTRLRVLQRSLSVDGQAVTVRVAYAEEQIRRDLASFLLILAVGLPLAVIAASLAGYWLAGHALAPVARMTEEARAITADHLDARLPVPTAMDELGQLATTFNDLFARLERSFEQMRRFTADASHELRTPLTVIRSVGEVGLREPHTEAEYRDTIGTMLEEVERLTLLTTTLLELTRAEGGRVSLKREPFDRIEVESVRGRSVFRSCFPGMPWPRTWRYAHVGDIGGRSVANEGLNANIGLVVTPAGAVLIDSGATWRSARDIQAAARRVTPQPIRWVINTGGQDHRWLGNGYFQAQGAELIAHAAALPTCARAVATKCGAANTCWARRRTTRCRRCRRACSKARTRG
jgi:signal transduction histidine kinase